MPEHASHFRFGKFELDCAAGELRKSGIRLKLEDQPYRLLCALIERQGEVLTREDLHAALLPQDTYVDFDRSLTRGINKVRTVLGDSALKPRYIETLPRQGYRFVAPVSIVNVTESLAPVADVIVTPSPAESQTQLRASTLLRIRSSLRSVLARVFAKKRD